MSDLPEYVLDREFDAPRDLVWRAWTDPEILHQWYGPGVETVIHRYDLEPGGAWLNEMKFGEKSDYSRMDFQEVVVEEKIVWLHSSTDADWNVINNPMMPGWPRVLLTTVTFTESGEKTNVQLRQVPVDASDEELACFEQMKSGMDGGWGKGYAMIDEILASLKG